MEQEMINLSNILVYRARIAKGLIKRGHHIVDIAPYREDKRRTVFYFAYDDTIYDDLTELTRPTEESSDNTESGQIEGDAEESHAD